MITKLRLFLLIIKNSYYNFKYSIIIHFLALLFFSLMCNSSKVYAFALSFEFKLNAKLEQNDYLTIDVTGINRIKDDILSSLYNIRVKFFIPYFKYNSEVFFFKDILPPGEKFVEKYTLKIPAIQYTGYYTIFGIFTMTDVNSYPLSSVTYTVISYGDTRKLFFSNPILEMLCSPQPANNGNTEEEICFNIIENHALKINYSVPIPLVDYLRETGIAIITQPEFSVTPESYKFDDSEKRTVKFKFSNNSGYYDNKYVFYVYSYINYVGVDDIYHLESISIKHFKKVSRKLFEWSGVGALLPLSVLSILLFLIFNAVFTMWKFHNIFAGVVGKKILNMCDNILLFVIFFIIYSYLFSLIPLSKSYFHPDTPYIAGDNATHYNLAKIVKDWSIEKFIINTWDNSHFCGYKIFQMYFPLPFILIALISYVINFNIAFKIIHIIGTLLLPLALIITGRLFGFSFTSSSLLSILSLLFLVMSSKDRTFILWGGNLTSTLAGEFCFSFSLLFFVLYIGVLYTAITSEQKIKYFIPLVILEVITGLSHAFTMLYILFFLFLLFMNSKLARDNFLYIISQQFIVLGLMFWWLGPMIYYKNYTFSQWYESWDKIIFLHSNAVCLAIIAFILFLFSLTFFNQLKIYIKKHKILFIVFCGLFILGVLSNYVAYLFGVADIRFFPLALLALIFLAGFFFEFFSSHFLFRTLFAIGILFLTLWIIKPEDKIIKVWSSFNGKGLKLLNYYEHFESISDTLKGDFNNGRILYDKSNIYDPFGSPLALTLLPHYAQRQVLDGMDYRSSASSFFAFDTQTNISSSWGSYPDGFRFSNFNLQLLKKRAKILNIENVIVADPNNVKKFLIDPDFKLIKKVGPFNIFFLTSHKPHYIEPLKKEPFLVATRNWKAFSYRWFKNIKLLDYPVIFIRNQTDLTYVRKNFTTKIYIPHDEKEYMLKKLNIEPNQTIDYLPETEVKNKIYNTDDLSIDEHITFDKIELSVNKLNIPLYVKVNYHPGLKVIGADYIYFASPSFFIIIPRDYKVKIYLGYNLIDKISLIFSYLSLLSLIMFIIFRNKIRLHIKINNLLANGVAILSTLLVIALVSLPIFRLVTGIETLRHGAKSANRLLTDAESLSYSTDKKELYKSKLIFEYILEKYAKIGFLDEVLYKYAELNFKLDNLNTVDNALTQIFKRFPESIYYGKGLLLWAKLFEKMGTDESIANAKLIYQIAKREYPDTEIEHSADEQLKKFDKSFTTPPRNVKVKKTKNLYEILKNLDKIQKENLLLLLQSKEFQNLLKSTDKKSIESIIEILRKK